jgi:hypothetical protein
LKHWCQAKCTAIIVDESQRPLSTTHL